MTRWLAWVATALSIATVGDIAAAFAGFDSGPYVFIGVCWAANIGWAVVAWLALRRLA